MRTFGKALMLAVALGAVAGIANARHGDDKVVIDRGRYEKAVSQLLKDIEELDDRNENNPNKQDRKWTRERLEAMRQDLAGIRTDLQSAPPAVPGMPPPPPHFTPPPPPPAQEPMAMNGQQFSEFVGELKKQSFDRERLGLLKEVAGQNWFTTDQVIQSMALFSFSSEKIAAGTAMYPRVVDRGNWYKVYSTFTFSSDQEKLRKQTSGK